jgi:acyl-coenzyme A thioesterase PaaI-like protein
MTVEHGSTIFRRGWADGLFEATPAAAGPWSREHCHGGAPAALLASAMRAAPSPVPMALARITVDLLGPVPVGVPLRIETRVARSGRRMQLVEAGLYAGEVRVAQATALKVRSIDMADTLALLHADPDPMLHQPMPGGFSEQFTIVPQRGAFGLMGPADIWFRLNGTLIEGAHADAVDNAVAIADFGSGIAHELPFTEWLFPTLDLTVSFARPPCGAWTLLEARWLGSAAGRAICVTQLGDARGAFGQALQTMLIERRAGHR